MSGVLNFLPKSTWQRADDVNHVTKFVNAGYKYVTTKGASRLLGLFNTGNIDGALDRFFLRQGKVAKFSDQRDLNHQVTTALGILSKKAKGFVLMVESGHIDKYSHSLDCERSVYDTIMLTTP
jgi:alkaline phosphatase